MAEESLGNNTVSSEAQHANATRQATSSASASSSAEAHHSDSHDSQSVPELVEHSEPDVSGQKVGAKDTESEQAAVQHEEAVSTGVDEQVESVEASSEKASEEPSAAAEPTVTEEAEAEPTLRVEPEDAAQHAAETPKRRQLRADTAGEDRELYDDEVDEYRLVDFEGIGRSFKRRVIERRKEKERKKVEKAKRAEALAKQKAERKALEAERKALEAQQRREAKEAADAEKARIAQEQAEAREAAAMAAAAEREAAQYNEHNEPTISAHDESYHDVDDYDDYAPETSHRDNVVRTHPTLEKALRHDVNSERARDALTDASEMVVISVLSREPEGFDGGKLLELIMACGLRYSREMGVFHRFETESFDSELQFSMVNVLKPGTFPIEEMDEFVTPGITFLMPLPGAEDSSAAFEAMVETAMVVVRHMGGELKDENRSVMTAQTIEFARQRVHEFERRHRLQRQLQAR
ncbi:hypothetical protein HVE01_25210 [Vreelandella venusta]|nr:hypothetical protein HVE01_25210 [Halomonas venusta]